MPHDDPSASPAASSSASSLPLQLSTLVKIGFPLLPLVLSDLDGRCTWVALDVSTSAPSFLWCRTSPPWTPARGFVCLTSLPVDLCKWYFCELLLGVTDPSYGRHPYDLGSSNGCDRYVLLPSHFAHFCTRTLATFLGNFCLLPLAHFRAWGVVLPFSYPYHCPSFEGQSPKTQTNKITNTIPIDPLRSGGDHYAQNHPLERHFL